MANQKVQSGKVRLLEERDGNQPPRQFDFPYVMFRGNELDVCSLLDDPHQAGATAAPPFGLAIDVLQESALWNEKAPIEVSWEPQERFQIFVSPKCDQERRIQQDIIPLQAR
jgi:hypothetical protein